MQVFNNQPAIHAKIITESHFGNDDNKCVTNRQFKTNQKSKKQPNNQPTNTAIVNSNLRHTNNQNKNMETLQTDRPKPTLTARSNQQQHQSKGTNPNQQQQQQQHKKLN
jgi:hypothetical protein